MKKNKKLKSRKDELLKKYATKPVSVFTQYDCFIDAEEDSVMHPDRDGDVLFRSTTAELMSGAVSVRVLISPEVKRKDAIRALQKIAKGIDKNDSLVVDHQSLQRELLSQDERLDAPF